MRMRDWLDRELGARRVGLFCVLATFAYVLPLILADHPYIDDNWRSLAAGTGWAGEGRLFTQLFYNGLTFTGAAPNIFPLPLLLATLAMAWALTRLTFHYFVAPTLSHCLVVLGFWYNPFFLQNLSYQYDGPAMTLSLVAVIGAMTFRSASRVQILTIPALLIALGLGLYQVSINVFVGLCCLELLRWAHHRQPDWHRLIAWKLAQLGLALLIYGVTAYAYMKPDRTGLLDGSADPLLQVGINIGRVLEKVGLLFHGGLTWVLAALWLTAIAGSVVIGRRVMQRQATRMQRGGFALLCLLSVALIFLLVPGAALLFRDFNEGARTLMGFSVLLLLLFYLSHLALTRVHRRLPLLLLIPLLAMLSLSYAYGRVLVLQKTFATAALNALSYDIASRPALREAKRIYLSVTYSDHWLTAAAGSFRQLPVLHYLLNTDYYMLVENLPKVGITNVVAERERRNATRVGYQGFAPVVDSLYYRIYLIGDYGFIVMKEPAPVVELRW